MKKLTTTLFSSLMLITSACSAWEPRAVVNIVDDRAELSWTAPVTRTDGSVLPITEIGGYEIAYGVDIDLEPSYVSVPGTEVNYEIENLNPGTNEFMIRVFDVDGLSSSWSDAVVKAIKNKIAPEEPVDITAE